MGVNKKQNFVSILESFSKQQATFVVIAQQAVLGLTTAPLFP